MRRLRRRKPLDLRPGQRADHNIHLRWRWQPREEDQPQREQDPLRGWSLRSGQSLRRQCNENSDLLPRRGRDED